MSNWSLPAPPPPQGRYAAPSRSSWAPATPVSPGSPVVSTPAEVVHGRAGFKTLYRAALEAVKTGEVVKARRRLEPILASYEAALTDAAARSVELAAALAVAADLSAAAEAPREAAEFRRRSSRIWELLSEDYRGAGDEARAGRAQASARDMTRKAEVAEQDVRRVGDRMHNLQLQDIKRPGLGSIGRA